MNTNTTTLANAATTMQPLTINVQRLVARRAIAEILWTDMADVEAYQRVSDCEDLRVQQYTAGSGVFVCVPVTRLHSITDGWSLVGLVSGRNTSALGAVLRRNA
jgi:hypothetical protein